jgi:hypothetical protein
MVAFVGCTVFVGVCSTTHTASKHETMIVNLAPGEADPALKKYAVDGWTCVGVMTGIGSEYGYLLLRTNEPVQMDH